MGILDRIKDIFAVRESAAGQTIENDEDGWRRLTGDTDRDLAPITQRRAREVSAWLWQANLMANRIIELPLAYLLADGVRLEVNDEEAQAMLNRFWNDPINSMDLKLEKKVRELALFGEQCYPAFVNEHTGHIRLGYLDPALIETVVVDPDNPEQQIGIVTAKDKKGGARRFRVIVNGEEEELFSERTRKIRESFTDGDAFYFNINSLSSGARGRPDLLASADWLDAYDDFLFGEVDRNRYLRAFVWDVTLKGSNSEDVAKRALEIAPPAPNSVRVHNDSETWNAITPDIKSADTSESARLLRNHVLGGATLPEHWYGGGGDVNRATGESMGDPAFKMMSMRQRTIKYMLEQIARFAIRQWALKNQRTVDLGNGDLLPSAVFPEMIARDTTRYAAALQQVVVAAGMAVERGLISRKLALRMIAAVASQLGVEIDVDEALSEVQRTQHTEAGKDVFPNPLEG